MRIRIAAIVAIASFGAVAAPTMYPVPTGAAEVGHVALQPGIAEQDHFFLAEKYPGASAMEHYSKVFSKWRPCYWNERGWSSFSDASGSEPRFIHRFVRHWVSPNN